MRTQGFAWTRDAPSAVVYLGLPSKHTACRFHHTYTHTLLRNHRKTYECPHSLFTTDAERICASYRLCTTKAKQKLIIFVSFFLSLVAFVPFQHLLQCFREKKCTAVLHAALTEISYSH